MSPKKLSPEQQKLVRVWNLLLEHSAKRGLGWTTTSLFALDDEMFVNVIANELTLARKRHEEVDALRTENRLLRDLILASMRGGRLDTSLISATLGGGR